jgi:radical SAM family uncharacterized protein/radical SAM-linked protein
MTIKTIQDFLPLVDQPSRYLGSEINAIKKDHAKVKLRFALAFPDLYEIGTSHFGLQILYYILNHNTEIVAERVYAPSNDMETYLRSSGTPITSLESRKPLKEFDIIGFSLLYELNYTNVLTILELANIPFFARERDNTFPIVIAGGPCTCNPEPVGEFFDAMVIGDGENVIMEMSKAWLKWKTGGSGEKKTLLRMWSKIEGIYIPEFFKAEVNKEGFMALIPESQDYRIIKRAVIDNLDQALFPDSPIVPYGNPVHDRLRLEVSRGCTRGCRFCQAGMIYRPVRERSLETLEKLTDASLASTGYEDISLLSLSTGDYASIAALMERLMARCESDHIAVSFPSLRAGTLTPKLMKLVKKVRKTGFTIAPEAGSQRLRNVINKNITEQDVVDTVKEAFDLGWLTIKLYFMIGLPTERDEDLQAIVELVTKLRKIGGTKNSKAKINVSVATFIPKPHTPFQWSPQISLDESRHKIKWLKEKLINSGIRFKWQNPETSKLEGLWARGDRRLSHLLVSAYKRGCKFDAWTDKFNYKNWEASFSDSGVDIDFYTTRPRDLEEPLPWDHIDTKVTKDFLKGEHHKAFKEEHTADCRTSECSGCGVCDFETIEPKIYEPSVGNSKTHGSTDTRENVSYKYLKIFYSKQDQAKYFGHLELVKIFLRAIRRAHIPVKFSQGFHPKPLISFEDTLPIGLESLKESFYIQTSGNIEPEAIKEKLNKHLPKGLHVVGCRMMTNKKVRKMLSKATYLVTKKDGFFDEKELESFKASGEFIVYRKHRKRKMNKKIDLKEMVLNINMPSPNRLQMTLKSEPGKTVRPFEVISNIFHLRQEEIKQAQIVKVDSELKT